MGCVNLSHLFVVFVGARFNDNRTRDNMNYIVRGAVTDLNAYSDNPEVRLGDVEWQFSDGPSNKRSFSEDFISLEAGLSAHAGEPLIFISITGAKSNVHST